VAKRDNLTVVSSVAVLALAFALTAGDGRAAGPGSQLANQVSVLENRFFFHLYPNDPPEKRLQRLELLILGATQAGSNDERLARLQSAILERDRQSRSQSRPPAGGDQKGKVGAQAGSPGAPDQAGSSGPVNGSPSSQYPILNTLEWRALKKTYAAGSLDARLERLETKLFGQSSPAMAYADRVERLKRTLGIGVAQGLPAGPLGPMPKARPRSGQDSLGIMPPAELQPFVPDPGFGSGLSPMLPFSRSPVPGIEFPKAFSDLFREMDRQMEQIMKMPPGRWRYDPESNSWIEQDSGGRFKAKPKTPGVEEQGSRSPELPPYYDPNSI